MQRSRLFHSFSSDDSSYFHKSLDVVIGGKQRELLSEEEKKDHPCRPHVDGCI